MAIKIDIKAVLIIGIAVMFLIQMLAFQGSSLGSEATPTPTPGGVNGTTVYGFATVNATLVSYTGGEVLIAGAGVSFNPAVLDAIAGMKVNGDITYYTAPTQDALDLIIPSRTNVSALAWALYPLLPDGANVSSRASISLPANVTFATAGGNVTAAGGYHVSPAIAPFLSEGARVPITIRAYLLNGTITDAVVELAETEGTAYTNATIVSLSGNWELAARIPWENRSLDFSALNASLAALAANHSLSIERNDSVLVLSSANDSQLQALSSIPFVYAVSGNTVKINESESNRSLVESSIRATLGENASLVFSESILFGSLTGSNASAESIASAFNVSGASIRRAGTVSLPGNLTIGGQDYPLPKGTRVAVVLLPNVTVGDSAPYLVTYTLRGATFTSLQ